MHNNINKHRPRIIKFPHILSYENSLNARFIYIKELYVQFCD